MNQLSARLQRKVLCDRDSRGDKRILRFAADEFTCLSQSLNLNALDSSP